MSEKIIVGELDPGVILEVTKPNGVTYQYKAIEEVQKHLSEIEVFRVNEGGSR